MVQRPQDRLRGQIKKILLESARAFKQDYQGCASQGDAQFHLPLSILRR